MIELVSCGACGTNQPRVFWTGTGLWSGWTVGCRKCGVFAPFIPAPKEEQARRVWNFNNTSEKLAW